MNNVAWLIKAVTKNATNRSTRSTEKYWSLSINSWPVLISPRGYSRKMNQSRTSTQQAMATHTTWQCCIKIRCTCILNVKNHKYNFLSKPTHFCYYIKSTIMCGYLHKSEAGPWSFWRDGQDQSCLVTPGLVMVSVIPSLLLAYLPR